MILPVSIFYLCAVFAAAATATEVKTIHFTGCCDASAAVSLTDELFVIANDEDNVLRVYSRQQLGPPVSTTDLTVFLNPGKKSPEVDIEAAARIGDRIYWISSHGRNAKGKARESRHRFFATTVAVTNGTVLIEPVGRFYADLLIDLAKDSRFKPFGLARASLWAPKVQGALNIEGLAATPEGHLLIGFRNPIHRGKALVVRLLNPSEVIVGKAALFGEPVLLDLGGFGIRSIEFDSQRYIVVGGASDSTPGSRLYEWSGRNEPPRLIMGGLDTLNPEAVAFFESRAAQELMVVSDDGTLQIRGEDCKRLKDPNLRRFRAVTLAPAPSAARQLAGPATVRLQP
jgi:hypothetical protein